MFSSMDLGAIFGDDFNWGGHVDIIVGKAHMIQGLLKRIF